MNKILIADDNKQITSILASYARKEGLEPVIALDGAEALDAFARCQDDTQRWPGPALRCSQSRWKQISGRRRPEPLPPWKAREEC